MRSRGLEIIYIERDAAQGYIKVSSAQKRRKQPSLKQEQNSDKHRIYTQSKNFYTPTETSMS
jgi:hypothetical protein